jgi:hypothetical protein
MHTLDRNRKTQRRATIVACIAAALSVGAPATLAANIWNITTCADAGPGSLRDTVGAATTLTGDYIDLRHLSGVPGCSNVQFPMIQAVISLTTGSIAISQKDLNLLGPGSDKLLVTRSPASAFYDRLLTHLGAGELHVSSVSLSDGYRIGGLFNYPAGGCIYSAGNLTIDHVNATNCKAIIGGEGGYAYGGAVYARGTATVSNSTLTDNVASVFNAGGVRGGAIYARGNIGVSGSVLTNNSANGDTSTSGYASLVYGGAIAGHADVTITASVLSSNSALTDTFIGCGLFCTQKTYVGGGAVFAKGLLTLANTDLLDNSVTLEGKAYGTAEGGAALSIGRFAATYSVISGNKAIAPAVERGKYGLNFKGEAARAGGVYAKAGATISASTISGNDGGGNVGGMWINAGDPATEIENTTISGNSAYEVGGAVVELPATIRNSTISFNTATYIIGETGGAGLLVVGNAQATLVDTLISNNTAFPDSPVEDDLSTRMTTPDFKSTSSNNLVRASSVAVKALLPADTIMGSCPLLGPLRDNGGPTPTHALMSHSIAIDNGTTAGPGSDQRGPSYFRPSGASADIGAYEVQQDEIVFTANMEGCP